MRKNPLLPSITSKSGTAILGFSLSMLLALSGCGRSAQGTPTDTITTGVHLKGAGSTLIAELFKQWMNSYQAQNPKVGIQYEPVGSGEGLRRFIGKNLKDDTEAVDFGASDTVPSDAQTAQVSQGAVVLPVAASSVVLVYNLADVTELKLSRKAYAGIFLGDITRWDDPLIAETNPGKKLPGQQIWRVVRQDSSGTTFAFTNHLNSLSEKWHQFHGAQTAVDWPGSPMRAPGNEGVAARVKQSVGSIGYVAYVYAREAGLPTAVLENKSGSFVNASESSALAALDSMDAPENMRSYIPDPSNRDAYPIVTFSWVLFYSRYQDPTTSIALRDFFHWCLTDGQNYLSGAGYIHLPPRTMNAALAALDTL